MSPAIGPIAVLPSESMGMLLPGASESSDATQRLVDEEVRRIVDSAHREVVDLLRANRTQLDDLVAALLSAETLDESEAYAAVGLSREAAPEETGRAVATALLAPPIPSSGAADPPTD
jgi:cell division protease FtsH